MKYFLKNTFFGDKSNIHEIEGDMIPPIYDEGFTEGTKIDEEKTGEEIEIMTKNSNVEEDDKYPYSVEGISYGFKNEMDADLFELLLDDIAQLDISEKVKVLKYIKNLKISKENK